MADILKLVPASVGEDFKIAVNDILDSAKDNKIVEVVVIGRTETGEPYIASSEGITMALWLIEKCKLTLFDRNPL